MIKKLKGSLPSFLLETEHTSYIFAVRKSGHLEHLYYGPKVAISSSEDCEVFREKREFELGNSIIYSKEHPTTLLEDMCLEISSPGHGDVREPFIELVMNNGSRSLNFLFDCYEMSHGELDYTTLPTAYSEDGKSEHLCVKLKDGGMTLELHYRVFAECDVITRSARLINGSPGSIEIERLLSTQIDVPFSGVSVTSFHGAWAREMNKNTASLTAGKFVIESRAGCSSNRANPFFMVHEPNAGEFTGGVYGFNLIYSGNHYAAVEVNAYGKTRITSGIQPDGFRYILKRGEAFEAPEAVMTFSTKGFSGQSENMHRFVSEHIVRGTWKNKPRPVLLNSWEACYFNVSEKSMVALAKAGKELGIELFVMDDGWFGERSSDTSSLGDWYPNQKKLPTGLKGLADKINALDMQFGIWVEPEMVNTDSNLYREHPDWTMEVPGQLHSEGRNQRILDLANPKVQNFLINKMTEVFSSANISYVKWDMNRIFSDAYSQYLQPKNQGETAHRYITGLYRMMKALVDKFPEILFEGCASGGNRFDLGILCYFPQIWGSDNTDAICRATIQEGYSYGYPQSCVGAHVSASPNHQTLRCTAQETRFDVAAFGVLGYEYDVRDLNAEQRQQIKSQIALYKQWRDVLQYGRFYRIYSGNLHQWICVSPDKRKAVGMLLQELMTPNTQSHKFFAYGLNPEQKYKLYNSQRKIDIKLFGSLINTMAPFHIKQDSFIHNVVAKYYKMDGEAESFTATGKLLMTTGVALSSAFSGTGLNEHVRVFPDFASRIYFIEAVDEEKPQENSELKAEVKTEEKTQE